MTTKKPEIKSTTEKTYIVGVDDGFAETKVVILEDGVVAYQGVIPSRARSGAQGTTTIGGAEEGGPGACYETEGVKFTVGDLEDSESARFDEYPFSGMNRVIVHHALRVAGMAGKNVRIATGLPLSRFYRGSEPNAPVIARKNDSIRMDVKCAEGMPVANIVDHSVFPEGLAAWVDYALDEKADVRADLNETVGVIDIGGRTTDIAVVLPGKRIDHARCGSADMGVLNVVEEVRLGVQRSKGPELAPGVILAGLRTGRVNMWGKPTDISAEIEEAVQQVTESILREVDRRLGSAVSIDRILLVGGGAHLFKGVAKRYPHILVPDAPEFANARGFAKYLSV
jgi:plasmid segregation protein ParM